MVSLLLRVLPLAFGAAVSPTVLTVIVLLLAESKSRRGAVGFGLGTPVVSAAVMAANFSSLVLYVAGLKEIVRADVATATELAVNAVFIVIMLLPVELPLLLTIVAPGSSERILTVIAASVK